MKALKLNWKRFIGSWIPGKVVDWGGIENVWGRVGTNREESKRRLAGNSV
jgi:hypothetical protein